eukprot:scaffold43926_cov71-Phaeocystis_antarctica.AAC.7
MVTDTRAVCALDGPPHPARPCSCTAHALTPACLYSFTHLPRRRLQDQHQRRNEGRRTNMGEPSAELQAGKLLAQPRTRGRPEKLRL